LKQNYEQDNIVHAIIDPDRAGINNILCGFAANKCVCPTCCNDQSPGGTRLVDKPLTCVVCLGLS
jgi:hypothetical protein